MNQKWKKALACVMAVLVTALSLPVSAGTSRAAGEGDLTVTATLSGETAVSGADYTYADHCLTIISEKNLTISGSTVTDVISVSSRVANITIKNLSVKTTTANRCAFSTASYAGVNLTVVGSNVLVSGTGRAGLEVSGSNASLTITKQSTGTLDIQGGELAAGIGGAEGKSGENITIAGGSVAVNGGSLAAAIGGGYKGSANNITVSGGSVSVTSGMSLGIGGGIYGNASNVKVSGGTISLLSNNYVGIGACGGVASGIQISGGTITIVGGADVCKVGIGAYNGSASGITISGGTITASGVRTGIGAHWKADDAAVAGSGSLTGLTVSGGKITISGPLVGIGGSAAGKSSAVQVVDSSDNKTKAIQLSGGEVSIQGAKVGIGAASDDDCDQSITVGTVAISGGTVSIVGSTVGIGAVAGNGQDEQVGSIALSGGNTTINGGYIGIGGGTDDAGVFSVDSVCISGDKTVVDVSAIRIAIGAYNAEIANYVGAYTAGNPKGLAIQGGIVTLANQATSYPLVGGQTLYTAGTETVTEGANTTTVYTHEPVTSMTDVKLTVSGGNVLLNPVKDGKLGCKVVNDKDADVYLATIKDNGTLTGVTKITMTTDGTNLNVGADRSDGKLYLYLPKDNPALKITSDGQEYAYSGTYSTTTNTIALEDVSIKTVFHFDNGQKDLTKTVASLGSAIEIPETPTRAYYDFSGWYEGTSSTSDYKTPISTYSSYIVVNKADMHYWARWEPHVYTITYDLQGGDYSGTDVNVGSGTIRDSISEFCTPVRTGYKFNGWYTAASGGTKVTSLKQGDIYEDMTLYAQWTANKYTVKFNKNGGSKVSSASKVVTYAGKYGTLPTAGRKNYTFAGWYTAASGGTKVTSASQVKTAQTHTLYAHWTKVSVGATKITSLKNSASKKAKISYSKVSGAKGYEIVYAKNSAMTSGKKTVRTTAVSKTFSGLTKGRTYYFRVRAYKTDSLGNRVYGKYTAKKKVKISK